MEVNLSQKKQAWGRVALLPVVLEFESAKTRQNRNPHPRGTALRLPVIRRSLQLGEFRLGLLEDRNVGVGVFPEGEEILVCDL